MSRAAQQAGLAPIVIVVIIAALAAVGGFFVLSKNSTSNPVSGIINKTTSSVQNQAVNKEIEAALLNVKDPILRQHYQTQFNLTKSRTKMPIEGSGPNVVFASEISGNMLDPSGKVDSHSWMEQNGKRLYEIVDIGNTIYVKDKTDNKWWKGTKKTEKALPGADTKIDIKEEYENLTDSKTDESEPKKIGEEPCPNISSLTCYKYQEINKALEGMASSESKTTFWFDKEKFLRRKDLTEYKDGQSSWQEYEYDNIDVSAPSPTKDVPPGKSIEEIMSQVYMESVPSGTTSETSTIPETKLQQPFVPETSQESSIDNSSDDFFDDSSGNE